MTDFKRHLKRAQAAPIESRPKWMGSPSSYAQFTFSSTVNHRIHNHQDIPDVLDIWTPSANHQQVDAPAGTASVESMEEVPGDPGERW